MTPYWVYIVKCADGTLYTGASTDPVKRTARHNAGKGARYTRARLPVRLVYSKECHDWPAALREENRIKRMSRKQKEALIAG